MRTMGLQAVYPRPRTSLPRAGQTVYLYLLKGLPVITPTELKSIRDELEEEYQAEVSLLMSLPVVSAV